MTQFRTVGPSTGRMPAVSAPASRSRSSAGAGKSAPHLATTPTSPVQVSAAAAACTVLPPSVPIWLLPSGWMTSSMVRLPTIITGRPVTRGTVTGCSCSFGRDLLVGQVQVDAAALVVQERADVPQHAGRDHAAHELQRQVRGHGERGPDRLGHDE